MLEATDTRKIKDTLVSLENLQKTRATKATT